MINTQTDCSLKHAMELLHKANGNTYLAQAMLIAESINPEAKGDNPEEWDKRMLPRYEAQVRWIFDEWDNPKQMKDSYDIPDIPRDATHEHFALLYKKGMIMKKDLKDGGVYFGGCRNATIARWSKEDDKFTHWRCKWGSTYEEKINYPTDELYYDVFVPLRELDKGDYVKPKMK
jgi:hypothetical protein